MEIPELKNASSLSEEQIKTKEGELILKNLKPSEDVILLDERGHRVRNRRCIRIFRSRTPKGELENFSFQDDFLPPDGESHIH